MNIFIYLHIEKSGIAVSDVIEQKITEHKKYKSILCYTIIYTFKYLHPSFETLWDLRILGYWS